MGREHGHRERGSLPKGLVSESLLSAVTESCRGTNNRYPVTNHLPFISLSTYLFIHVSIYRIIYLSIYIFDPHRLAPPHLPCPTSPGPGPVSPAQLRPGSTSPGPLRPASPCYSALILLYEKRLEKFIDRSRCCGSI